VQDLDSFRKSFWVEEKCWFVAYRHKSLFSVPYFNQTEADESFELPLYSTVPDNKIFYESINKLDLSGTYDNRDHYFTHVQTLTLRCPITVATLESTVAFSRIQRLNLQISMTYCQIIHLIDKMPNLCHISIGHGMKDFLKQIDSETMEKIKTLEVTENLHNSGGYDLEKLCNVFPNIEHLHVAHIESTIQIFDFLDRFKHLSTASFQYTSLFANEDSKKCLLKMQSMLDRMRCLEEFNYTYRFDSSSVYIWI
jgi:hypothetical protein